MICVMMAFLTFLLGYALAAVLFTSARSERLEEAAANEGDSAGEPGEAAGGGSGGRP